MKKIKTLMIIVFVIFLLFINIKDTVFATEIEPQEQEEILVGVEFSVTYKNAGAIGDIYLWLQNNTTDKCYSVVIPCSSKNIVYDLMPIGEYTMVNSEMRTADGHLYDNYEVLLDDFTLDVSKLDWEVEVIAKLKPYDKIVNKEEKKETSEPVPTEPILQNQFSEEANAMIKQLPQYLVNILTDRIEEDNPYFPNMTIFEIQMWYLKSLNEFLGKYNIEKDLDYFVEKLIIWADWVGDGKGPKWLDSSYNLYVKKYNKEDTLPFYEVQKRIYDFIKSYYDEKGKGLDFSNWNYDELFVLYDFTPEMVVEATRETVENVGPSVIEPIVDTQTDVTPTIVAANTPIPTIEPTKAPVITEEPTPTPVGNKFLEILKSAWVTIIILIVFAIVGIVLRIKYKKRDE